MFVDSPSKNAFSGVNRVNSTIEAYAESRNRKQQSEVYLASLPSGRDIKHVIEKPNRGS